MSKVMISVPEKFLKEIDKASKAEHRSRSELIRESIRWYLSFLILPARRRPIDSRRVRHALEIQKKIADKDSITFDTTSFIRRWRDKKQ